MKTNLSDLIGNTPLIRLNKISDSTGCEILGKAEFLNPGQSVKDRAALSIIEAGMVTGKLRTGGTIVEGTAGNTGIGLTLIGASKGCHSVIVIPNTQSQEKKDTLRNSGARLVEVPAVPYSNPNNYVKYSERLAQALNEALPVGAFWANQFDNLDNRAAHEKTTGPEIYQQTNGLVDGFICSVGTGGTLAGVAKFLRIKNPEIKIGLADPMGSALHSYFTNGKLSSSGESVSEGIGQGRVTENLRGLKVDFSYQIPDSEAMRFIYDLCYEEGLSVGLSSGINMAGAVRLAGELGKGSTIVTILCDHGMRYQSKIYNHNFLKEKKLPLPFWMEETMVALPSVEI
ncbi:MAG: cysteine synthase A [Pseudomonadota bacterium]|nr:cysteine synthase A [Pseudomonadota bacterium]